MRGLRVLPNKQIFYKAEFTTLYKKCNLVQGCIACQYYQHNYVINTLGGSKVFKRNFVVDYTIDIDELKQEYRPKPVTWREQTKLDIDRLIYGVENINELWEALRKISYDVKMGKYISLKPKNAERALRTKSLGAEYSEEMIKQRINANRNYEKNCNELIKSSVSMEREFHVTVKNVVILIYSQKKSPQKVNKDKPYTIKNDRHINELVNCINFLKTNAITSGAVLQSRLETSEEKIAEAKKNKGITRYAGCYKRLMRKGKTVF